MFLDQRRIKERKIVEKLKWKKKICIKIPITFLSTTLDNGKSIKEKLELRKEKKKKIIDTKHEKKMKMKIKVFIEFKGFP